MECLKREGITCIMGHPCDGCPIVGVNSQPLPSAGLAGCAAFEAAKMAAIDACCGIQSLSDAELLARLEEVFWKGFKEADRGQV